MTSAKPMSVQITYKTITQEAHQTISGTVYDMVMQQLEGVGFGDEDKIGKIAYAAQCAFDEACAENNIVAA